MSNNKSRTEQKQEEALKKQQLYDQFLKELNANQALLKELENYSSDSVKSLLQDYAKYKTNVVMSGPVFKQMQEKQDLGFTQLGMECLKQIQQKKLFDLQCQWRAEQIQLPGILATFDFAYWEQHILQCPFLPPVTSEEVALYERYLDSEHFEPDLPFLESWQNYEAIKATYLNNEDSDSFGRMPQWYDFHNEHTGSAAYLLLPDIRGEKELHYHCIWVEKVRDAGKPKTQTKTDEQTVEKNNENAIAKPVATPSLPYPNNIMLKWFANTFDNTETQQHMNAYFSFLEDDRELDTSPSEIADELAEYGEVWPMSACADWYHGLQNCLADYTLHKTKEALPVAFEQYEMFISMGIDISDDKDPDYLRDSMEGWRNQILIARRLSGEPEDFNF